MIRITEVGDGGVGCYAVHFSFVGKKQTKHFVLNVVMSMLTCWWNTRRVSCRFTVCDESPPPPRKTLLGGCL